ncbi:hypothetical protein ElyMa_001917900 [Elysia marginata]|uniref:Uncharacterized protein n=1 Tax=Elysia marginata TaxID=1093978 RepID=A0AAV4EUI7_9GAST|nr:hypothetical protein ElyMa_001917900 [Elysia marginata]
MRNKELVLKQCVVTDLLNPEEVSSSRALNDIFRDASVGLDVSTLRMWTERWGGDDLLNQFCKTNLAVVDPILRQMLNTRCKFIYALHLS